MTSITSIKNTIDDVINLSSQILDLIMNYNSSGKSDLNEIQTVVNAVCDATVKIALSAGMSKGDIIDHVGRMYDFYNNLEDESNG